MEGTEGTVETVETAHMVLAVTMQRVTHVVEMGATGVMAEMLVEEPLVQMVATAESLKLSLPKKIVIFFLR